MHYWSEWVIRSAVAQRQIQGLEQRLSKAEMALAKLAQKTEMMPKCFKLTLMLSSSAIGWLHTHRHAGAKISYK